MKPAPEGDLERWRELGLVLLARSPEVLAKALDLLEWFAVTLADSRDAVSPAEAPSAGECAQ